jgi:rSAM/selenodomain-associated transferase 1
LVIFARRPRLGVGKRRLAAEVGNLAAWRFQRYSLSTLLRGLSDDRRWTTWLAITPDRPTEWVQGAIAVAQGAGNLGERLARICKRLPGGPVVIIGSDAPQVRRSDIATAFKRLGRFEAVFGPSIDGGFWLTGLSARRRSRPPFENVRWSTAMTLADTVANLHKGSVDYLRPLEDVDDAASLRRVRSAAPLCPIARAQQALRVIGEQS